ncbi:MAG: sugar phosphate isomerase/epimerase [Candidatus Azotimanducaceae bacterium]|jgi:sugar phosphate isomerase/epimerase
MQRRRLLKVGAGSLLVGPAIMGCQQTEEPNNSQVAASRTLDKFGLQLSTVTPLMLADFEGTLQLVAKIGYQQIEFSAMGFLGRSVTDIQKLLTDNNLQAPVGRISPVLPAGFFALPRTEARKVFGERSSPKHLLENVSRSLEDAVALGQRYLVLPALMPDNFQSLDQVKSNIELINQAGELCAEEGVEFGYHNHNWELAPLDGVVPYDLMLEQTEMGKVTFQLDAYWITKGGGDLFDYLSRFPGRFSSCHMKDIDEQGDFADVGHGLIDFPRFTREALAHGSKYFFVERDGPPNPQQSIQHSYAYLKQMTF